MAISTRSKGTARPSARRAKPGAKAPGAKGPTDVKRKQKRTIFSEQDRGPRLQARGADLASTTIRSRRKRRGGPKREAGAPQEVVIDEPIILTGPVTVRELAERVNVTHAQIITQLIGMGVLATVNQMIEPEQAMQPGAPLR